LPLSEKHASSSEQLPSHMLPRLLGPEAHPGGGYSPACAASSPASTIKLRKVATSL
jgi:hypothetical protein